VKGPAVVNLTPVQLDALYLAVTWLLNDDLSEPEQAAVRTVLQPVEARLFSACRASHAGCPQTVVG
jgi:hypothetical protein